MTSIRALIYAIDENISDRRIEKIILETPTVKKRRIKFEVLDNSVPLSSLIESKNSISFGLSTEIDTHFLEL